MKETLSKPKDKKLSRLDYAMKENLKRRKQQQKPGLHRPGKQP